MWGLLLQIRRCGWNSVQGIVPSVVWEAGPAWSQETLLSFPQPLPGHTPSSTLSFPTGLGPQTLLPPPWGLHEREGLYLEKFGTDSPVASSWRLTERLCVEGWEGPARNTSV